MLQLIGLQIINGLVAGSNYALVAVGMTMIFGVLRAINFAHGEFYMIGAVVSWFVISQFGIPYPFSIIVAVLSTATVALVVGRFVMKRLIAVPSESSVLATIGVSLVLQNLVVLIFGGGFKMFPGGWLKPISIFGMGFATQRLVIVAVVLVVFGGLELLVRYTRFGKSIRAVSQNMECCEVVGIDVGRVVQLTFLLGTALAGLAGVLTGPITVSVYGAMGAAITLKTFAIIVMGGMGNVRGTLVAGILLGIIESFISGLIGLQYRDAIGFVVLIGMLMWRPHGLFSVRARF